MIANRVWVAVLPLLFATACTSLLNRSTPSILGTAQLQQHTQTLASLDQWELNGRISVTNAEDGWHGNIRWEQSGDQYSIRLVGPLGQGRLLIQGQPGRAELVTGDGQSLLAENPEQLLLEATGMTLPVAGLRHWLKGIPAPTTIQAVEGNEAGLVIRMQQDGWDIDYRDYDSVDDYQLPERIYATHQDVTIKLAISQWQI